MRAPWKIIASALTATAAAAGVVWLVFFSPHLRFETLRIEGNNRASAVAITHLAALPEGAPLFSVDIDAAVSAVSAHPWIAEVRATRHLPDTITLTVVEREAVGVLVLEQNYLVDAEGTPFLRAGPADLDHPFVTGVSPELAGTQPALARRIVKEGLARVKALTSLVDLKESDVSEVHFDSVAGYTLVLRNDGRILLGFRDPDQLDHLVQLTRTGLDLSRPYRIDLAPDRLAVVTPL